MPKEHVLVNDIITDHRERMQNLKKYYPFFRLSETSFSWFLEGSCDNLDMGYILMAVLRFFIEENNFKEQDVTYAGYMEFMSGCLKRDFGLNLSPADNKVLVDYIFDKLKNEGKPFSFEYFDPVERAKKVSRVRLIESRIEDGKVWYSISSEAVEFYLDTKEIRDESRISIEQLLLEKMIESRDFKGGAKVIWRINQEVERLWLKKNQVLDMLTTDVFSGMEAYKEFFDTGIRWFDEEQKLFDKNRELIEAAQKRAESEKIASDSMAYYKTIGEIFRLDTELKVAMNNHSELLRACTDLGIKADDILRKSKLSRLRSRFDFKAVMDAMIKKDEPDRLKYLLVPFFQPQIQKTFDLLRTEDVLTYKESPNDEAERIENEDAREIVFEDEIAQKRFEDNARTLLLVLLNAINDKGELSLNEYNEIVSGIFGEEVFRNGDYFAFLVHFCGKKEYYLTGNQGECDTFLDEVISGFMEEKEFLKFNGMHFVLELADGEPEEIIINDVSSVTNFMIRKV